MRTITALLLLLASVAASAEIRVNAYAEPDGDVYLGQRVRLIVDVGTETWFTSAPRYPELKLGGAIALLPEGFGVNFTEREGGKTWAVQRQRYVLFPQRVGELTIPPIEIPLAVSSDGRPGATQIVRTPPVTINVVAPPGTADVPAFVTTPRLTVSEEWDRDFDGLKVGDAIARTITQKADDVFALVLPAIEFADIEGLGTYPATPELDDRADRGRYSATRVDRVTYIMQAQGEFVIPAIELHWFDPERRRMLTEALEAAELTVAPNPDAMLGTDEVEPEVPAYDVEAALRTALDWLTRNIHWLTLLAGALYAGNRLWQRFVPAWARRFREARERRRESEAHFFGELRQALRSGNEDRIVESFWRWADRLPGREPPLSLDTLLAAARDTDFVDAWVTSEAVRYRGVEGTPGDLGIREFETLRRSYLAAHGRPAQSQPPTGRLNPGN